MLFPKRIQKSYTCDADSSEVKIYSSKQMDEIVASTYMQNREDLSTKVNTTYEKEDDSIRVKHTLITPDFVRNLSEAEYKNAIFIGFFRQGYHVSDINESISENGSLNYGITLCRLIQEIPSRQKSLIKK